MAERLKLSNISFSKPGWYRIEVLGRICPEIWENFEGKTEYVKEDKQGKVITTLKIYVRDQAELSGLINTLYNWQLVLLSVKIEGITEETET